MTENDPAGPLHLQRYLTACADSLAGVIRSCASHSIDEVRSLQCLCRATSVASVRPPEQAPQSGQPGGEAAGGDARPTTTADYVRERTAIIRRQNIESSRKSIPACRPASVESAAGKLENPEGGDAADRRVACRFFSVRTNDEEGIVHSHCRRCERLVILYDRALYWGVKRGQAAPPTYPHMCSCGGHTFEVALGFTYPPDRLDENDLDTLTIAVRCAHCNEVAVIFDDEAN